eukprot:Gb_22808 [translate_table: standard]
MPNDNVIKIRWRHGKTRSQHNKTGCQHDEAPPRSRFGSESRESQGDGSFAVDHKGNKWGNKPIFKQELEDNETPLTLLRRWKRGNVLRRGFEAKAKAFLRTSLVMEGDAPKIQALVASPDQLLDEVLDKVKDLDIEIILGEEETLVPFVVVKAYNFNMKATFGDEEMSAEWERTIGGVSSGHGGTIISTRPTGSRLRAQSGQGMEGICADNAGGQYHDQLHEQAHTSLCKQIRGQGQATICSHSIELKELGVDSVHEKAYVLDPQGPQGGILKLGQSIVAIEQSMLIVSEDSGIRRGCLQAAVCINSTNWSDSNTTLLVPGTSQLLCFFLLLIDEWQDDGVSVRVKRPSDYNPLLAAALGPSQPSAHLNLAAVGLVPGAMGVADGPDRIFVGGLPYYLTEEQIVDLLSSFGSLGAFDLVKDRETGNSKGYGFCVYKDPAVIDIACAALNGLKMGDRTLTVRRASASLLNCPEVYTFSYPQSRMKDVRYHELGARTEVFLYFVTCSGQPKPEQADVLVQAQQQIAVQKLALQLGGATSVSGMMPGLTNESEYTYSSSAASKVVQLSQVVGPDELRDDNEYEEILEDMRDECGTLTNLVIPRPGSSDSEDPLGVGMVFVEYSDTHGAAKAVAALNGRKFGGNIVLATFYPEEKFLHGDYGG